MWKSLTEFMDFRNGVRMRNDSKEASPSEKEAQHPFPPHEQWLAAVVGCCRGRSWSESVVCRGHGESPSTSTFHPRSTLRAVARGAGGGWCVVRCRRRRFALAIQGLEGMVRVLGAVAASITSWVVGDWFGVLVAHCTCFKR